MASGGYNISETSSTRESDTSHEQDDRPRTSNAAEVTDFDFWTGPSGLTVEEENIARAIAESIVTHVPPDNNGAERQNPTEVVDGIQPVAPLRSLPSRRAQDLKASSKWASSDHDDASDLKLRLNNEFPALNDPEGDTAIYISPPPRGAKQTEREYKYICDQFSHVHVVRSSILRAIGSKKIDAWFGPISLRVERRLRKAGLLVNTDHVHGTLKYYVDLTPPTDDIEAILLVTSLTCTKGLLNWHLAIDKYGLPPMKVLGQDDFGEHSQFSLLLHNFKTDGKQEVSADVGEKANENSQSPEQKRNEKGASKTPYRPMVLPAAEEYSKLRHHSGIVRMLYAMMGEDPKLDSAPKIWTFFSLADHFGCATHERISGWITSWIYNGVNANFIQCNPEVTYKIGMGIRSVQLVKDSYSILVGERALLEVFGEHDREVFTPGKQKSTTVHGRRSEEVEENERDRINNGASALVARMRQEVRELAVDMDWLMECPEYQKLASITPDDEESAELLESTKDIIQEWIRSRIYFVLCKYQYPPTESLDPNPGSTEEFRPGTYQAFSSVYNNLNQPMRLFTKTFWLALAQTSFDVKYIIAHEGTCGQQLMTHYCKDLMNRYNANPKEGIKNLRRIEVELKVSAVNERYLERSHARPPKVLQGFSNSETKAGHLETNTKLYSERKPSFGSSKHVIDGTLGQYALVSPTKRRKTSESEGPEFTFLDDFSSTSEQLGADVGDQPESSRTAAQRNFTSNAHNLAFRPHPEADISMDHMDLAPDQVKQEFDTNDVGNNVSGNLDIPLRPKQPTTTHQQTSMLTGDIFADETKHDPIQNFGKYSLADDPFAGSSRPMQSDCRATTAATDVDGIATHIWGKTLPENNDVDERKRPAQATSSTKNLAPSGTRPTPARRPDSPIPELSHMIDGYGNPIKPSPLRFAHPPPGSFEPPSPTTDRFVLPYIFLTRLFAQVADHVAKRCNATVYPAHLFQVDQLPTDLCDTLLCLTDNEFRHLPLWIPGGCDDGTGGVYNDNEIRAALEDESFGPGRVRLGHDAAAADDDEGFTDVASEAVSTLGRASRQATDGTRTVVSVRTETASETSSRMTIVEGMEGLEVRSVSDAASVASGADLVDDQSDDDTVGHVSDNGIDEDFDVDDDNDDDDGSDIFIDADDQRPAAGPAEHRVDSWLADEDDFEVL